MRVSCPDINHIPHPEPVQIVKDGSFYRPSDGRRIQRYRCKACGKRFSSATFHPAFRQNKRRINSKVKDLYASGVSIRRIALLLKVSRTTVVRKVIYLSKVAVIDQQKSLTREKATRVQFDDLITIEHTKCKPLSVTIAVNEDTRKILGVTVSSMPAFGKLARIARKKYGYRKDERENGIKELFTQIQEGIADDAVITSDEHTLYPKQVKRFFPNATHRTHKGEKGSTYGQGELKKVAYDPLFAINHTCAMFRANINRLIRRTWCTTKKPEMLLHHLRVYMDYHNKNLV